MIGVNVDQIGFQDVYDIESEFTKPNPAYHMMKNSGMKFDEREIPKYITNYVRDGDMIKIPRGTGKWMRNFLESKGYAVTFSDKRITKPQIDFSLNFGVQCANGKKFEALYEYQKRGVDILSANSEGMFIADCGGGKTLFGISLIDRLKQPTLVFVHTSDLAAQWVKEISEKGKGCFTIGKFGLGSRDLGDITIATVQSFYRLTKEEKLILMSNFGMVILDECHHAPADSFEQCLNAATGKYRFGLTATPNRSDGLDFLMFDLISRFKFEVKEDDLSKSNARTAPPDVIPVITGINFNTSVTMSMRMKFLVALSKVERRNDLIVGRIYRDISEGRFPLIISQFVENSKIICEMLRKKGLESRLLIGAVLKNDRAKIIEDARKKKIHCIVATKVADEGLDIPQLDSIHLVIPHSNPNKLKQQIGRILRSCDGKSHPVVYDYVDSGDYLFKQWTYRLKLYRSWGYNILEKEI